jgi:hypothetical protein
MKLEAEVDGREYGVDIERRGGEFSVQLDGRPLSVDARALEGFFTSILVNGHAYEVTVEPEGEAWRVQVGIETHKVVFLDPAQISRGDRGASRLDSSGRRQWEAGPAAQAAVAGASSPALPGRSSASSSRRGTRSGRPEPARRRGDERWRTRSFRRLSAASST